MAKQFSVNLLFNANTQQAKNAIKDLQKSLDQVNNNFTYKSSKGFPISKELREANDAALKLKAAVQAAMNPETNTLQLDKFNITLKSISFNKCFLKFILLNIFFIFTIFKVLNNFSLKTELISFFISFLFILICLVLKNL